MCKSIRKVYKEKGDEKRPRDTIRKNFVFMYV